MALYKDAKDVTKGGDNHRAKPQIGAKVRKLA
jgi:hypothetical protein